MIGSSYQLRVRYQFGLVLKRCPAITITVVRSGGLNNSLTVNCATVDGTATNGVHYTGVTGALNWPSGDSSPRTFTVPLVGFVMPATSLSAVLLPDPLRPITP